MKIEMCEEFFYRINEDNEEVFKNLNTSKENVLRNNEKLKFYKGECVKIKVNDFNLHHVRPAENLARIAKNYDVDESIIIKDNNLQTQKLFIGQTLKIHKEKNHW